MDAEVRTGEGRWTKKKGKGEFENVGAPPVCCADSARGDVKTRLVYLIFHVAGAVAPLVAQHFGENAFECVGIGVAPVLRWGNERKKVDVGNVKRGAETVCARCCGVSVALSQLCHVGICAQNGGDDELLEGISLVRQAVEKRVPDFFEQSSGARHKIGDAVVERADVEVRIVADVH